MDQKNDVGFLLKHITECIEKTANQYLKQYDLTLSQIRILFFLQERKGIKTSQKNIEDYLNVTHPTVIGILKRLESKGFIESEHNFKDKRVKSVYLKLEKEASVYCVTDGFKKTIEQKLLRGLTDDQIKELQSLLNLVYRNFQASENQETYKHEC